MDAEDSTTKYLEVNIFLERNPCVKPRTFARWKKRGLIDFIQPGGPNTQILVPEDALERMEQRRSGSAQSENDSQAMPNTTSKGVRPPEWM